MKAIAKTKPELGVEIVDVPVPKPGAEELLVKVAACGICGSDLHIYLWELGAERAVPSMPAVIGHEPAGEVVEVGKGVTGFKVGDHVALDPFGPCGRCPACTSGRFNFCHTPGRLGGAFAEYSIAPVRNSWVVPKAMDMEQAAMLEPFATGLHAIEESSLAAGDSAVIEGPGPIGLCTALAARALGLSSIVITGLAADAERLALAREMGFKTVCASDRDWIDQVNPRFSAEVAGAFADDGCIPAGDLAVANAFRESASNWLDGLLDGRRVLCMPTSPILPIGRDARLSEMRTAVHRIVDLTAIAGLTGLPQVNLPMAAIGSIPVGLSLVGWRGGDAGLVGAACAFDDLSTGLYGNEP